MVDPANVPGERRLAHPPSDRYKPAEEGKAPGVEVDGSPSHGFAFGLAAALAGGVAIVVLGGVMAVTAGLIVVAVVTGWAVGASLGRRRRLAVVLTLIAITLSQFGLWGYGRSEGGVLGPLDFLWQVYGGLVLVELAAGTVAAWIATR
jgi:hypothetical protein